MIKEKEVAMVNAASKALEFFNKNPFVEVSEIIQYVMQSLNTDIESKIQAVSAVNAVVKLKRENLGLSDRQIIQMFLSENKIE